MTLNTKPAQLNRLISVSFWSNTNWTHIQRSAYGRLKCGEWHKCFVFKYVFCFAIKKQSNYTIFYWASIWKTRHVIQSRHLFIDILIKRRRRNNVITSVIFDTLRMFNTHCSFIHTYGYSSVCLFCYSKTLCIFALF